MNSDTRYLLLRICANLVVVILVCRGCLGVFLLGKGTFGYIKEHTLALNKFDLIGTYPNYLCNEMQKN